MLDGRLIEITGPARRHGIGLDVLSGNLLGGW